MGTFPYHRMDYILQSYRKRVFELRLHTHTVRTVCTHTLALHSGSALRLRAARAGLDEPPRLTRRI